MPRLFDHDIIPGSASANVEVPHVPEQPKSRIEYAKGLELQEQQWARVEQVKFYENQLPGSTSAVDPWAEDPYKNRSLWRGLRETDDGRILVNARFLLTHDVNDSGESANFDNLQAHIGDLDPNIQQILRDVGPSKVAELATLKSHVVGEHQALKLFTDMLQEASELDLKYIVFGLYPDREKALSRILGRILIPAGEAIQLGKFDIDFIPYVVDVDTANEVIRQVQDENKGALGVVALSRAARNMHPPDMTSTTTR